VSNAERCWAWWGPTAIPTEGTATVAGHDIRDNPLEVRASVGYLPEHSPLYVDMEVREYLDFMGRARGLEGPGLKKRLEWVVERCAIREIYRDPIPTISFGFRQRVCLAQALIHDPPVLILDEPTTGLDPLQIVGIRHLIRELAADKAVIFSTHILEEAAVLSDRIVVIHRGRVVADGTREDLQRRAGGGYRTTFAVEGTDDREVRAALEGMPDILSVEPAGPGSGGQPFLLTSSEPVTVKLYEAAREKGWTVRRLAEEPPSIEETFIALTHPSGPGEEPAAGAAGDGEKQQEVRP